MSIINDFVSLIYPRRCEACSSLMLKHEAFICSYCTLNLPKSFYHQKKGHELEQLLGGRIPAESAGCLYLFEKSGRVQKLLHAIKYQNQKELARHLGKLYARDLLRDNPSHSYDIIIPIPLHESKRKSRGFNQSEWFALGLGEELKVPVSCDHLYRISKTSTQTRKRKFERWENVEGIFELRKSNELKGKHVLLADDVITTGATLESAWLSLRNAENVKISVAAIAFAARGIS